MIKGEFLQESRRKGMRVRTSYEHIHIRISTAQVKKVNKERKAIESSYTEPAMKVINHSPAG